MAWKPKITLITFLCLAVYGHAQKDTNSVNSFNVLDLSLEELLSVKVNVSTTIPTEVYNSPATVTVVDRELINQYNFMSVAEALRQVAGVEVLQTVIDKNVPTIRGILQNFYANKVLIMIDNVPVWNPTYGNTSIDRISINDVERIEVLKGPASVLYGTNAYNGVVNIVLRKPGAANLNAHIDGGYPNLGSVSLNYGERRNDLTWNVSGHSSLEIRNPYLVHGGPDTLKLGTEMLFEDDTLYYYTEQLRHRTFNTSINYKSHSLFVNSFANSYTSPGLVASYQSGANRTINEKGTVVSYKFNYDFNEKINFFFNTYYDYHYRKQQLTQADAISALYSSYRIGGVLKLNYKINKSFNLELGADLFSGHNIGHEIVAVAPDTVIETNIKVDADIIEGSVFTQLNYQYKWINVIGGLRYNGNSNSGHNVSPQVVMQLSLNKTNKVKVAYGRSFRTPNLIELYFDHWTIAGNPDLKPETSENIELIYQTRINKFYSQVTAYHTNYYNVIQRAVPTSNIGSTYIYTNAIDFQGYGVEFEMRYQNPKIVNLFMNYNYIEGNDKGKANYEHVPVNTLAIGVHKPIGQFFLSTNVYAYSECVGPWNKIEPQLLWDAHIGYRHQSTKGLRLIHSLSFKNITDSDMLIPEYIRNKPNVNELATTGFGRRFIYTLKLSL